MGINNRTEDIDLTNEGMGVSTSRVETLDSYTNRSIDYSMSIGFGAGDLSIMSASRGSDYTNNVSSALTKEYANSSIRTKPKIHVFDKEIFTGLAYSAIITALEDGGIVSYFTILLEATGRKPLTADEIITEYESASKNPNLFTVIYTADDAIETNLHNIIIGELKKTYDSNKRFKPVDGIVISPHVDVENAMPMIATIAYNACKIENTLDGKVKNDLNIEYALSNSGNKRFDLESFMHKSTSLNEVGSPVRTDWKIDLNLIDNNNGQLSINSQSNKQSILRVGGYVDATAEEVIINNGMGMPAVRQIRLRPQIVITTNSSITPTPGFTLLSLITSIVMTNKNMWLASLRPNGSDYNVGSLNVLTNIENNQEGGAKLDLGNKKYPVDAVYTSIGNMFSLDPIVSFDIAAFGPQAYYQSMFSMAASSNTDAQAIKDREDARRYIIKTASWLTSGRFPEDFPTNEIFATEGVVIPLGRWSDKGCEKDIREIDLAFIANNTNNMEFLTNWSLSNLPKSVTGYDPYLTKINIISKIIPSAEITGKANRVTFTSRFIKTLEEAVVKSGLNVRYVPAIRFAETSDISIMSNYMANAGINNVTGFAQANSYAGPNYNTAYGYAGYNRYN